MFIILNSITLTLVLIIFFFIHRDMKYKEAQRKLAEVDNPTKHL